MGLTEPGERIEKMLRGDKPMKEDFLNMLHEQHMKIQQEMTQLQKLAMRDKSQRKDAWKEFKHNLTGHMDGEEKYWYPVLERNQNSRMDAQIAHEEHRAARKVFDDLDDTDMEDTRWMACLMVLQNLLNQHIQYEESRLFPESREEISDRQTDDIMHDFQKEMRGGLLERIMR
jgi:hemerythrin-like domain-containing protein